MSNDALCCMTWAELVSGSRFRVARSRQPFRSVVRLPSTLARSVHEVASSPELSKARFGLLGLYMDYIPDRLILEYYYSVILCLELHMSECRHVSFHKRSAISPASQLLETLRISHQSTLQEEGQVSPVRRMLFDVGSRMAPRYVGRICL